MTNEERERGIAVAVEYFGDAIAEVGLHSIAMNEKHNPGEPVRWDRDKSKDHWGSYGRHLSKLGTVDPESGRLHDVSWLWRTLAINQIRNENT